MPTDICKHVNVSGCLVRMPTTQPQYYIVSASWMLMVLTVLYPQCVQSACLGVAECSCEPSVDGSERTINCRNRQLTSVPQFQLPDSDTQYEELTLAGNRITIVGATAFAGLAFRRLDLTDNPLESLDRSAFGGGLERELTELRLTLGGQTEFPVAALTPLVRLGVLHVTGFGGRQLPTAALSTLSELVELKLTSGSVTTLNVGDLQAQRGSLQTLSVHGNDIAVVPSAALSTATMLKNLDLSHNHISRLPADAFAGLVYLNVMDLSNNGLGGGGLDTAAFRGVGDRVRSVTMKSCQLTDRDVPALRQLRAVSELVLSYNSIANLPNTLFDRMRSLRKLYLDNNRLQTVAQSTFSSVASTLELLDIGHNPLSSVSEDAFVALGYLKGLHLDGVKTLKLSGNSFSRQQRGALRMLSVRRTQIGDELWPLVSSLEGLNSLAASDCSVSAIPDFAFRRNTVLQTIDLSRNSISSLTRRSVYGLDASLSVINLNGNRISAIHPCTFHRYSASFSYFKLGLGANPLLCDCDIRWLHSLLSYADSFRLIGLGWQCSDGGRFAALSDADFASCQPLQPANCSDVTPPPDLPDNSTETDRQYSIIFQAYNVSDTVCQLEWTVLGDTADITGFTVSSAVVHGSTPATSLSLPGEVRQHRLTSLRQGTEYTICITVKRRVRVERDSHVCTSAWTNLAPHNPDESEYQRRLAIILGSICGSVFAVALIAVVLALVCRCRSRRAAKIPCDEFAAARNATTRPQVGYGSKRFTKDGAARIVAGAGPRTVSAAVNGEDNRQTLTSFTLEERAKIRAMLAGTSMSGLHDNRNSSNGGFRNVAFDPGSTDIIPDNHVYDSIPGDNVYDIPPVSVPLDSAV